MTLIEVCQDVTSNGYAFVRETRNDDKTYSYELKRTGKKKGWCAFDSFTASAVLAVYNALNADNQAKLNKLSAMTVINFAWKHVKAGE